MTPGNVSTGGLERLLGRLLLAGAAASALSLAAGLVLWLLDHASTAAGALLNAGLVVLMLAPAFRIVIALVESLRLRDWLFVASTLIVAAVLGVTLTLTLR